MQIENGRTRLVINRETGSIMRIVDTISGTVHLDVKKNSRQDARLFTMIVPRADWHSRYIDNNISPKPKIEKSGSAIIIKYPVLSTIEGTMPISAEVSLTSAGSDEIRFVLKVKNDSDSEITDVWFPQIAGWTGLGGPGRDKLIYGGSGSIDPHAFPINKGMTYLRCHQRLNFPSVYTYTPWIDLSGPEGGISYISYHNQARNYSFAFENLAGFNPGLSLCYGIAHYTRIEKGQTWQSPPMGISLHPGDWRDTADSYNDWTDTWYKPADTPLWARQALGFQNIFFRSFDGTPIRPLESIPHVARIGQKYGVNHLCVWDYNTLGNYSRIGDHDILDYSDQEKQILRKALAECKQQGIKTSALICWSYFNRQSTLFKEFADTEANRRWDGSMRTGELICSEHGPYLKPFHIGPSTHMWDFRGPNFRNRVKRQLRQYLELGYTSLFYDSSFALESYTRIGDALPHANNTAAISLDKEVREIIKQISPDGIIVGEQGNPFASQYIDLWMEWYQHFDMAIRAAYSLPRSMRSWVTDSSIADAVRAFACGMQLCLTPCGSEGTMDDTPQLSKQVAKMAKLRSAAGRRFYNSIFRHTRGLNVQTDGGAIAFAFDSTQGPTVVAAAPQEPGSAKVSIDLDAFTESAENNARLLHLNGKVETIDRKDNHSFQLIENDIIVWMP